MSEKPKDRPPSWGMSESATGKRERPDFLCWLGFHRFGLDKHCSECGDWDE